MVRTCILLTLAMFACSSSPSSSGAADASAPSDASVASDAAVLPEASPDAAPAGGACASLPASAKLQGTGCTAASGTFTEVTYDSVAGTYSESCGIAPYADQADFDANEGTSTVAGTTITSHEDYVVKATCASGSIDYQTAGSAKTTIVFVWTKAP